MKGKRTDWRENMEGQVLDGKRLERKWCRKGRVRDAGEEATERGCNRKSWSRSGSELKGDCMHRESREGDQHKGKTVPVEIDRLIDRDK